MQHYVLIDGHSGYVWEEADADSAIEACRIVDDKLQGAGRREYWEGDRSTGNGYFVYLAPADWKPVSDGQSQEEIERVEALPFVAKIEYRDLDA